MRLPRVVLALACALIVFGLYALAGARFDVFPEFSPPTATIQTEAPGLDPEQVEVLVTQVVEGAVAGLPGLETLRSSSIQGLSVVTAAFRPGSDVYRIRQRVNERIAALPGRLPQGVSAPSMTPLTSSTLTVLLVGLTSDRRDAMALRTVADWTVRPRLQAVPGIAQVSVYGGAVRSLQVQVRPDVLAAARKATGVRGAGFVDTPNQRVVLRTEGQSLTPEALGQTVLANDGGASVVLSDVATVTAAPEPAISGALVDGKPGVLLMVGAQVGVDTLAVTARLEAAIYELRPALEREGVSVRPDLFRPADFVGVATGNVLQALAFGGVLVVIVLLVFLADWRTALISAAAIPLSLVAAALVLQALGAGPGPDRRGRAAVRAPGDGLHRRGRGVPPRGPDGDAGPVPAPPRRQGGTGRDGGRSPGGALEPGAVSRHPPPGRAGPAHGHGRGPAGDARRGGPGADPRPLVPARPPGGAPDSPHGGRAGDVPAGIAAARDADHRRSEGHPGRALGRLADRPGRGRRGYGGTPLQ